ncbi:protein Star-like [Daphnia pulex]|uniref:protein Star-like n=1 Tax=Daphnia pulex TaxID=6669 RepID=UPI001EE0C51C|nr:protein Star-like [Daphnia pulex]
MAETYGDNWAEASADVYLPSVNCTIEYANANKLQQDHPCVIRLIRRNYLLQPAPKSLSYRLDHPGSPDPSDGQSQAILEILQNKTNGFFIECGGYDGEFLSNTLFMERYLGWSGLLIEADRKAFNKLLTRNRKAYTTPVCLSTELYPIQVNYNATVGTLSSILETNDVQQTGNLTGDKNHHKVSNNSKKNTKDIYKVQCFPLYSILLAIGRTHVDYFGLDVEGSEYKILKTIPWQKINVKTLTVEWNHTPEGEAAITRLMESNKFIKFGLISMPYSREVVYVRDFLNDYRKSKD